MLWLLEKGIVYVWCPEFSGIRVSGFQTFNVWILSVSHSYILGITDEPPF